MIAWFRNLFYPTKWLYLGYRDIYVEAYDSTHTYTVTIRFYCSYDYTKRKVELVGSYHSMGWVKKNHGMYIKYVVPWLKGDGLPYQLVDYPSNALLDLMREQHGLTFDYDNKTWARKKTVSADNVVSVDFTKRK